MQERAGVGGVAGENGLVGGFGLGEAGGPVQRPGVGEGGFEGAVGHGRMDGKIASRGPGKQV